MVETARRGDREAFTALVHRYERLVAATVGHFLLNRDDIEEVSQEVFITAYTKLYTLRNPATFGAWLMQIARRKAWAASRKNKRVETMQTTLEAPENLPRSVVRLDRDEEALLKAMLFLADHECQVVTLKYFNGHSTAEIAQILDRKDSTIRTQLARAISHLRKHYERQSR